MHVFLEYLVVGIVAGAIYAVTASGLVVTYTTSGVFNFAHGAIGMVAAFSYWALRVPWGWPTLPAVLAVVLVAAPIAGALLERGLIRHLHGAPTSSAIGVTLGLLLALVGVATLLWSPTESRQLPALISATSSISVFGVQVSYDQLVIIGVAAVVAVLLRLVFHRTRAGVAMRAVVDDPELLALAGASPGRTAQRGWMLGASLAAAGGVLVATIVTLDITTLTLLVVSAYAAAIFGRLRSVPLTFVGALVLGEVYSFSQSSYLPQGFVNDVQLQQTAPMILLFIALLFLPQGRLRTAGRNVAARLPVASLRTSLVSGAALVLVTIVVSGHLSASDTILAAAGVALSTVMLSLVLLTGYGGQISCCQLAFAGLGAFAMAKVQGGDSPLGLVAAFVLPAAAGALVALPAIRLQGLYLALGTLAFGAAMDYAFFQSYQTFGYGGSLSVGRAALFGSDFASNRSFLILIVVVFALAAIGVLAVRRSRFGRRLVALNDSPAACATLGIGIARTKLVVFALASGLAGLAGALYSGVSGQAGASDFQLLYSLTILLLATVWGIRSTVGVLLAGLSYELIPLIPHLSTETALVVGLGAITISRNQDGTVGEIMRRLAPLRARLRPAPALATGTGAGPGVVAGGVATVPAAGADAAEPAARARGE